jgi:hypothetical protein
VSLALASVFRTPRSTSYSNNATKLRDNKDESTREHSKRQAPSAAAKSTSTHDKISTKSTRKRKRER